MRLEMAGDAHAPGQLPELVPAGTSASGRSAPMQVAQTGIPEGLPLIAAASDKACEVIGAGCLTPDVRLSVVRHGCDGEHHARPVP
jgi:sugar (pentulose or hexulose) kinase